MKVRVSREAESLDSGTGTILARRESASRGRTKLYHAVAKTGIADDLDQDDGVIADRERVRACARLRIAVNDHRLVDVRQRGSGRDGLHAGARNVKRDQVRPAHWRRVCVRRINGLPQRAVCTARRSAGVGCRSYGECHRGCRRGCGCRRDIRRVCRRLVRSDRR